MHDAPPPSESARGKLMSGHTSLLTVSLCIDVLLVSKAAA